MATTRADDEFLQLARDRFDQAQEADNGQRSRELEDLQTYAGNVWTAEELKARGAQPSEAGMPPIPARQSLSIPLLQEPVKQVVNDLPWQGYRARYGATKGNYVTTASLEEFRALGDEAPGWFTTVGDTRICRVVDYWYTTRTTRELVLTAQGVYWSDELPAGLDALERREVIDKAVKWAQLDGAQVLDRTDWPGPDVPIIKVLGEELQPYDQERRAQGMVRPAKDSIKGFAAMVSKMVEEVGLTQPPSL